MDKLNKDMQRILADLVTFMDDTRVVGCNVKEYIDAMYIIVFLTNYLEA